MDTSSLAELGTAALLAATFAFAFVSGIIPFVLNIELYLLAVAALTDASLARPPTTPPPDVPPCPGPKGERAQWWWYTPYEPPPPSDN